MLNKSRYAHPSPKKKQYVDTTIITYDELNQYLNSLQDKQGLQLLEIIKTHALIQDHKQQKYYESNANIMQELRYLIDQHSSHNMTEIHSNTSLIDQSNQESNIKKQIEYFPSIDINPKNYKSFSKNLINATAISNNVFELCYEDKEKILSNSQTQNQIIISNRCRKNKRIYMIFEHVCEILQLQTLIDQQIPLEKLSLVVSQIQQENSSMFFSSISSSQQLYYFKRQSKDDWLKFIHNINKKFGVQDVLLMKFKYFKEVLQFRQYFVNNIHIVFDQSQISLQVEQINQIKVYQNKVQSIQPLIKLAIELLSKGSKHMKYKDSILDEITCFNEFLLEYRKTKNIYIISSDSKIEYIYFTFYRKLMLIERNPITTSVQLIEKQINQEITDKYYLIVLEGIKKHAVINQLPFIFIYQNASKIDKVDLSELKMTKNSDYTHLLAYQYLINSQKYKIVADQTFEKTQFSRNYQKEFAITFEKTSPLYDKLGAAKSDYITIKHRFTENNVAKGCIWAKACYCRLFISKYLSTYQLNPNE